MRGVERAVERGVERALNTAVKAHPPSETTSHGCGMGCGTGDGNGRGNGACGMRAPSVGDDVAWRGVVAAAAALWVEQEVHHAKLVVEGEEGRFERARAVLAARGDAHDGAQVALARLDLWRDETRFPERSASGRGRSAGSSTTAVQHGKSLEAF